MKAKILFLVTIVTFSCTKEPYKASIRIEVSKKSRVWLLSPYDQNGGLTVNDVYEASNAEIDPKKDNMVYVDCDSGSNVIIKINGSIKYNKWNYHHEYKIK